MLGGNLCLGLVRSEEVGVAESGEVGAAESGACEEEEACCQEQQAAAAAAAPRQRTARQDSEVEVYRSQHSGPHPAWRFKTEVYTGCLRIRPPLGMGITDQD